MPSPRTLYGEPWIDCAQCGFSLPLSHAVRHFRTRKLVDRKCADEKSQADYLEDFELPEDIRRVSPQPVAGQGEQASATLPGYGTRPYGTYAYGS